MFLFLIHHLVCKQRQKTQRDIFNWPLLFHQQSKIKAADLHVRSWNLRVCFLLDKWVISCQNSQYIFNPVKSSFQLSACQQWFWNNEWRGEVMKMPSTWCLTIKHRSSWVCKARCSSFSCGFLPALYSRTKGVCVIRWTHINLNLACPGMTHKSEKTGTFVHRRGLAAP